MNDLPAAFKFWPQFGQDAYREREAIMREGNNVRPDVETPMAIRIIATQCAEEEIRLYEKSVKV